MQLTRRWSWCLPLTAVLAAGAPSRGADAEAEKTALAVEALTRLQGVDLSSNPKLKEAVFRVLEKTRGTPHFVRLVQQFKLTGQNAGLLEVAIAQPSSESGVEAMRLILASGDTMPIEQALAGPNTAGVARLAEALGNSGDKRAVPWLLPLVGDTRRDIATRQQVVRSLARTADGAGALLKLAKDERLPDDLKFTASSELNNVRWPEIRAEAGRVLPMLQGQNAQPLPPIAELVGRKGDIANGERLFTNASPGCAHCHVVNGRGTELGPNLSEIGAKLGKDALYESILDPSAGISFGYEAFNFALKNGDEAYGLIGSETADELAVKAVGGIVTRLKKTEIASRQPSKLSIMPSGLQQSMTVQELADLVEYLSSLKKARVSP